MKTAHILALLVAVTAVAGVVDARDMALHVQSNGWAVLSTLMFSYLSFYWYRLDREVHSYRGSRWLGIGIVMLANKNFPISARVTAAYAVLAALAASNGDGAAAVGSGGASGSGDRQVSARSENCGA